MPFLIPTAPWAHLVFDLLAWGGGLAASVLVYRWRLKGAVEMVAAKVDGRYFVALAAGAVSGAWAAGSFNSLREAHPALSHSIVGALVGAIVGVEIYKAVRGIRGSTGGVFVASFAVGAVVGRLGCFFAGLVDDTYGSPTRLPWAVDLGDGVGRHPVQLYESGAMAFFLVVYLLALGARRPWAMRRGFYVMCVWYGAQRFAWEFLKPYPRLAGPFNLFHILCVGLVIYGWLYFAETAIESGQRKVAPYLFLGQTTSLCETCLELVPAKIISEGDDVFYLKRCREHGVQKTLISDDLSYWKAQKDWLKPGDRPMNVQTRTEHGCPYDCGLCPDHEQHSCLAIIEVNQACNLTCPVCFAGSSTESSQHRPLAEIERMLDVLVESEGEPDLVQLSGGEPTIHPQFFEILAAARRRPIRHLMINTNGIRIAREPGFAGRLAEFMPGFEVYLQFDSLKRDALMEMRGADLTRIRAEALEALERAGVSTTLVVTVKRGVNDDEIADIVHHALQWHCVRGVTFQPIQDAGRNDGFDPKAHRIVLTEIRRRIAETGIFPLDDLIPLPCNPDQICIGYGLRDGAKVAPVTSLLPRELFVAAAPNTVTFEAYPELRDGVFNLLSLSTAQADTSDKLAALLCCLPEAAVPQNLGYEHTFRVVISQFLDRYNFDLGTVKRSCVHFVEPDGRIIPFDTYNTFYRPGAAGAEALRRGQGGMR